MNLFGLHKNDKNKIERTLRVLSPNSSFGYIEAYKALRTNLNYILEAGDYGRVLMVTSSVPAEGKSNVSVNLAITLAEDGKKVILLDCDLRKGTLHRYLRIPRKQKGITNVLSGEISIEEATINFSDLGISVLAAGMVPPNPTELLGCKKMGEMLEELSKEYDYVLCDTPPVTAVSDTMILSKYADGAVLVVSHNNVRREEVLATKAQLENVNTAILGVVLNMYDAKSSGTDGTRYYSYYSYGDGYGSTGTKAGTAKASGSAESAKNE